MAEEKQQVKKDTEAPGRSKTIRNRIFRIISIGTREDFLSRAFDYFIVLVILLNISVMFFETFDELDALSGVFRVIEIVTILIFCVEYALRIWTAPELYPELPAGKAVLRFLLSADGVIDLLTILPFIYFSGFIAFRMLRVVRIFHLFRINSQYDSFHVITSVIYEKRNQIVSSVVIILILMMASSLCMYSVEHEAQPEAFRNAFSGIWWSLTTIFTVGYGDIYPVTVLGRCIAIVITFLGVGVVAIPTGIISAGFVEQYTRVQSAQTQTERAVHTVIMTETSAYLNASLEELKKNESVDVDAVVREGSVILPSDNLVLKNGDVLIYRKA